MISADKSPRPRRRRGARFLAWCCGLLGVLVVLVVLAPTLINWGVGRGAITGVLEGRVNGTVTIRQLGLAWLGEQSVRGLTVSDRGGQTVAQLDVDVSAGLLDLLAGRAEPLVIDVAGTLEGELRESGSTSFEDLVAPAPSGGERSSPRVAEAFRLPGVPPTTVRITQLDVRLKEAGTQQEVALEGVSGTLDYVPGDRVTMELGGNATRGDRRGTVQASADLSNLFDSEGTLTLQRASGRVDVRLRDVPVPLADRPTEVRGLTLSAASDDLSDRLEVSLEADAVIDGAETGRLEGTLAIEEPVGPDGSVAVSLDSLTGRITGTSVPTALLQPALRGTPIVAERDLGPVIDVDAAFSTGETRQVAVRADSKRVSLEFAGSIDPQRRALNGDELRLEASVSPELVHAVTGLHVDRAPEVTIDVDTLAVPPLTDGGLAALRDAAVNGTVTVRNPVAIALRAGDAPAVTLENLVARLEGQALGRSAALSGTATVSGAAAVFEATVENLIDAEGRVDPDTVSSSATATGVAPAMLRALAPANAELIDAALSAPLEVTIGAVWSGGELQADLAAAGPDADLEVAGRTAGELIRLEGGRGELTVTPALVAVLQAGAEDPVVLRDPARVAFELEPVDMTLIDGDPRPAGPLRGRVRLGQAVLESVPGFTEPVALRAVDAKATARLDDVGGTLASEGSATLLQPGREQPVAALRWKLTPAGGAGAKGRRLEVEMTDLAVRQLDTMLGQPAGVDLAEWVGQRGTAIVSLRRDERRTESRINAIFPRLAGELAAVRDGGMISVSAKETVKISLGRDALQRRLSPPSRGGAPGQAPPRPRVVVEADVPLVVDLRALRFPEALLSGEPFDGSAVDIDLALSGGPIVLNDARAGRSSIEQLEMNLATDDLDTGVVLSVSGDVAAQDSRPARLELDGRLTRLMKQGRWSPADAGLEMTADVRGVHSGLIDAALDLRGLLVAAVGPRVDLEAVAQDFSRTSGTLEAQFKMPNGHLDAYAKGKDNGLLIETDRPLTAELLVTPPLRQRLLSKIHPLLADIRSTREPLRATVRNAFVPLDGDVSRLNADLEMTVGQVEFDSGSVTLALMLIFQGAAAATVPGQIEPIRAKIRNGVVTYDRFVVKADTYEFAFSGHIDLNTQTMKLKTELPLEALAVQIPELRRGADELYVPVYVQGRFDDYGPKIDEQELARVLAEAGVRGWLEEELERQGVPKEIGGLLDGLFGNKKKKKEDEKR